MRRPMNVRVLVQIIMADAIDNLLRALGRRGIIQPHQRMPLHLFGKDRKICTDPLNRDLPNPRRWRRREPKAGNVANPRGVISALLSGPVAPPAARGPSPLRADGRAYRSATLADPARRADHNRVQRGRHPPRRAIRPRKGKRE